MSVDILWDILGNGMSLIIVHSREFRSRLSTISNLHYMCRKGCALATSLHSPTARAGSPTLRASDLHNARATILNPFNKCYIPIGDNAFDFMVFIAGAYPALYGYCLTWDWIYWTSSTPKYYIYSEQYTKTTLNLYKKDPVALLLIYLPLVIYITLSLDLILQAWLRYLGGNWLYATGPCVKATHTELPGHNLFLSGKHWDHNAKIYIYVYIVRVIP